MGVRPALLAASVLVVAGTAMVIGSFMTWGSCSISPCGAEFGSAVFTKQSGVEFGPGIATAVLGMVLVILGMEAARIGRRPPMIIGVLAALGAIVAIVVHVLAAYATEWRYVSDPHPGLYATTVAAVVSLLASVRLVQHPRLSRHQREGPGRALGSSDGR